MKRFLIDAKQLPLVEKAEAGEAEAQLELVNYYTDGIKGVPKDIHWARHYCYQLAKQYPKEISLFWDKSKKMEYARLFTYLGDLSYNLRDYREALTWYKKAEKHCRISYSEQGYIEEMKRHKIEEGIRFSKQAIKGKLIFNLKKLCKNLLPRKTGQLG